MSEMFESHGVLFLARAVRSVSNGTLWANKPSGGFWASPADSEESWKRWCVAENFCTESLEIFTRFTLSDDARVCVIASDEALSECERSFPRREDIAREVPSFADLLDACDYLESTRHLRRVDSPIISTPLDSPSHGMPRLAPVDFEALLNGTRYDALLVKPKSLSRLRRWSLHSWDCDTLLVANPKIVERIQYFLYGTQVNLDSTELERLWELRARDLLDAFPSGGRATPKFLKRCRALSGVNITGWRKHVHKTTSP